MKQKPCNHKERVDKIVQGAAKNGKYSVKKVYELINRSQRWEKIEIPLNL